MTGSDQTPGEELLALMRRERRRSFGPVPQSIGGVDVLPGRYALVGEEFLLRDDEGVSLHYRKAKGVTIEALDGTDPREIELWFNGTLYAAIASINGLLPLHASAVAHRGKVFAFSGPSGAGKSTLAAALVRRGFTLFCDDTLLLDPTGAPPLCLPGHKRLKLWPEGLELAGVAAQEQVAPSYAKHFASTTGAGTEAVLPLGSLVFIDDGEELAIEPLAGAERFARLCDDHYTAELHERASGMDLAERFRFQAGLARSIPAFRLARPFAPARFADMVDMVAGWIEKGAAG